jgi:hypothetical protein
MRRRPEPSFPFDGQKGYGLSVEYKGRVRATNERNAKSVRPEPKVPPGIPVDGNGNPVDPKTGRVSGRLRAA